MSSRSFGDARFPLFMSPRIALRMTRLAYPLLALISLLILFAIPVTIIRPMYPVNLRHLVISLEYRRAALLLTYPRSAGFRDDRFELPPEPEGIFRRIRARLFVTASSDSGLYCDVPLWMLNGLCCLLALALKRVEDRARSSLGLCVSCGYDLTGTPDCSRCAECEAPQRRHAYLRPSTQSVPVSMIVWAGVTLTWILFVDSDVWVYRTHLMSGPDAGRCWERLAWMGPARIPIAPYVELIATSRHSCLILAAIVLSWIVVLIAALVCSPLRRCSLLTHLVLAVVWYCATPVAIALLVFCGRGIF